MVGRLVCRVVGRLFGLLVGWLDMRLVVSFDKPSSPHSTGGPGGFCRDQWLTRPTRTTGTQTTINNICVLVSQSVHCLILSNALHSRVHLVLQAYQ